MDSSGTPVSDPCAVCLEDFEELAETERLPCGHTYHSDCIETWRHRANTCPTCRAPLSSSYCGFYLGKKKLDSLPRSKRAIKLLPISAKMLLRRAAYHLRKQDRAQDEIELRNEQVWVVKRGAKRRASRDETTRLVNTVAQGGHIRDMKTVLLDGRKMFFLFRTCHDVDTPGKLRCIAVQLETKELASHCFERVWSMCDEQSAA